MIAAISPLKISIVLFVIWAIFHLNAFAAIPGLETMDSMSLSYKQVPYFKSPNSSFPSGSATEAFLKKNQIVHTLKSEIAYQYKNKAYTNQDLKPLFPTHISQSVIHIKSKKRWSVLETKVDSILCFDTKTKQTMQFRIDEVATDPYDIGFAMTLKDSFLKKTPEKKSDTLTTVPQGQRFSVIKYKNGFAEVSYKSYIGFINVNEVITKFDFANYIYSKNRWHLIRSREFDSVITFDNKKIHFSEVMGMITPEKIGVIASKNQKLSLWSRVQSVKAMKIDWIQSKIKDHGNVWWKPESEVAEEIYTIDELLKKDIASVSFHPTDPLKAILSAHGVYMTEDGYHWKPLKEFKNFHGPVHYFNDLMIFIGNYRSTDQGKTFENYIQIDKLALAIQSELGFLPKQVKVKRISTLPNYYLKIEIETGNRRIKMQSPLFAQSWSLIKS